MEISIQKPCHENWDAMTPNEQGAFCHKCVKTVVDFSNKTIEEIKDFFIGKQNERVCGRFQESQLVALSFDAFHHKFKNLHFTKRFAVIVYLTFGMWLFSSASVSAQTQEPIKGDVNVNHNIVGGVRATQVPKDTTTKQVQPHTQPKTTKGKVKVKNTKRIEYQAKMGEVIAEPKSK